MPTVILNADELRWFSPQKYWPLRNASSGLLYHVLNDRIQLRVSVPYAPYLALEDNKGAPEAELSSQALRQLLAHEFFREDIQSLESFKGLFAQLQENPLCQLFTEPPAAQALPTATPTPAVASLGTHRIRQLSNQLSGRPIQEGDAWNSPEERGHLRGYVEIDLVQPDSAIEAAFKAWLKEARKTFAVGAYKRRLEELFQRGAIELIDLEFFRLLRQTELRIEQKEPHLQARIPDEALFKAIFPDSRMEDMESMLKTAKVHKDALLRTPHILTRLEALRHMP